MDGEPSPLSLMALQVGTLFRLDERGRMLCVNEMDDPPAPRFFMGRTREGNVWRYRHDLPDALVSELDRLCRAEPVVDDLEAPLVGYAFMLALLAEQAPVQSEWRGPCFSFPDEIPHASGARELMPASADLLRPHFPWLSANMGAVAPVAVSLDGEALGAVCFSSRVGPRACEAGVETLPQLRGRGHGAAAVARWAQLVRRADRTPLYSTSWDNLASRGIARRLGLVLYGEDFSIA